MEKQETKREEKQAGEKEVTLSGEEYRGLLEKVKELDSIREKLLRSAADYDNARKRLVKEREEFVRFSQERLLRDLLPILDNFERALSHAPTSEPQAVVAGVQLIWKQLLDILAAHGLKPFSAEGQTFNPHLHESVGEIREAGPEGVVVREITSGYLLHDRVLRPAKVQIRVSSDTRGKAGEEKEEEIT
jgi:molecular chaperone GrpE